VIPAGDSLAPGQLIPIVCKCRRLYLNRGSEPGLAGSGNPRWAGGADAVQGLVELCSEAAPRIAPCQEVSLLLTGLGDTNLVHSGFCLRFELYFGSSAAVPRSSGALPWSSGVPAGFTLLWEEKASSSLTASHSLFVPHLWGRFGLWKSEAIGHRGVCLAWVLGFLIFVVFPPVLLSPRGVRRRSPQAPGHSGRLGVVMPWEPRLGGHGKPHLASPARFHGLWVRAGNVAGQGFLAASPE